MAESGMFPATLALRGRDRLSISGEEDSLVRASGRLNQLYGTPEEKRRHCVSACDKELNSCNSQWSGHPSCKSNWYQCTQRCVFYE